MDEGVALAGVTALAQKTTGIKQVEQQARERSKFCMLVNVNLMNKQRRNKGFLGPWPVFKFVCVGNACTSQWEIGAKP